ncbi:DNA-directed DNA polymerase II small subunit [Thermococcus sp.]|uniref:DNA-directed DNA polymerase II small subunit n=1 Tax=Thermococcus sp. TaxID=35749 RepID=UPI002617E95C|nr:DNA-directed DNA polymerase II small subunit [Thermococcus sp.]
MGLVEDLLGNKYLITPPAYYLLADHYMEAFTLAELVKFAKSRGTFVIDSSIASDFLREKGIFSSAPLETPPEEIHEESEIFGGNEVSLSGDNGSELTASVETSGYDIVPAESLDENPDLERTPQTSISTGEPPETAVESVSSMELKPEKTAFSEGESFVSTGTTDTKGGLNVPADLGETVRNPSKAESDEILPLESGSSLRTSAAESSEASASESSALPVDGFSEVPSGTSLNGDYSNGYSNGNGYADSEEYYEENGEVKPKIVYGDYGVPIAYVEEVPEGEKSYSVYRDLIITPKEGFHYRAKEIPDDWEMVFDVKNVKFEAPKVKNAASKEGEIIIKSYTDYFKSRLRKMRRILRENPELGSVIDIGKLGYVGGDEEVTIIGLINSKRETAKGYMFEVEDNTGLIKVFINRNNEESKKFFQIMPDSVIGFRGHYSGRNIFFANKIFLPDVPRYKREKPPLEEKVYAVLLSDIHVGSNKFCERAFEKFLEWLNGEVNNRKEEELVSRIKYMILAGDVVDGVGIYPGQYNELEIPDIFDQYEALYNLLRNVPEHITMFIGPGNHDAARTALPQPGFYEEYARPLFKLKNAVMISNPAVVRLHGRDFLIFHGRGIEDVVNVIPNRSHHRPAEASVDLLKLRHLAPTFGEKVPIAPDPEDTLVIESVPDLFQTGHVHVMEYKIYNGVFVINAGTWQAQTEFQKMVNIVPTPARVPIIDVETARLRAVVSFDRFCEGV